MRGRSRLRCLLTRWLSSRTTPWAWRKWRAPLPEVRCRVHLEYRPLDEDRLARHLFPWGGAKVQRSRLWCRDRGEAVWGTRTESTSSAPSIAGFILGVEHRWILPLPRARVSLMIADLLCGLTAPPRDPSCCGGGVFLSYSCSSPSTHLKKLGSSRGDSDSKHLFGFSHLY